MLDTLRAAELLGPTSAGRLPLTKAQRLQQELRLRQLCAGEMPGWRPVSVTTVAQSDEDVVTL